MSGWKTSSPLGISWRRSSSAQPDEHRLRVRQAEDLLGQANGDCRRHGGSQHQALYLRRLGSQDLLREVAIQGLGGLLFREGEIG